MLKKLFLALALMIAGAALAPQAAQAAFIGAGAASVEQAAPSAVDKVYYVYRYRYRPRYYVRRHYYRPRYVYRRYYRPRYYYRRW